jgi:bifunctional non-homologous end joining protein LigD
MLKKQRKKSLPKGEKAPLPNSISPMLAQVAEDVPSGEDYIHEVKFDGYRILAYAQKRDIVLKTRKGENYSLRYPPVVDALQKLNLNAVLDGEVIVTDEEGKHDFTLLQSYQRTRKGRIMYYVFDILWLNGYNLMKLPLMERKEILSDTIQSNEVVKVVDMFEDGQALFEQCPAFGFEGIVSKKKEIIYIP